MVSSLSIDEQRDLRKTTLDPSSSLPSSPPANQTESYVYDSDDDQDPNEIVSKPLESQNEDPYNFDESDESD